MEKYAGVSKREDAAEWIAASFSLECFLHRACHFANDIVKSRVNGQFFPNFANEFELVKQKLIAEHLEWWDLPVIQKASSEELFSAALYCDEEITHTPFFDYPPFPRIKNSLFASLRNFWYTNYIYISILNYKPNEPRPHDPRRIEYAVEICRFYAMMGFQNFPAFDHLSIIMAAVAFAESPAYERESRWIRDHMNVLNGPGKNWLIIAGLYSRMGELWGKQYFNWYDDLPESIAPDA
jgi:hypothetical protein